MSKLFSVTSTILGTADALAVETSSFSWRFVGTQTVKTGTVTLLFLKLLEASTQFHMDVVRSLEKPCLSPFGLLQ